MNTLPVEVACVICLFAGAIGSYFFFHNVRRHRRNIEDTLTDISEYLDDIHTMITQRYYYD